MGHLLLAIGDDAGPIVAVGTAAAAVFAFAGLLARLVVSQQGGWRVLVRAAETRADASDARATELEHDLDREVRRAQTCEAQLTAAQQLAEAAQARAIAAEQRAVAAEGRADLLGLQLDEVRRELAAVRTRLHALETRPR